MKKLKSKKQRRRFIFKSTILIILILIIYQCIKMISGGQVDFKTETYISGSDKPIALLDKELKKVDDVYRGTKVYVYKESISANDSTYKKIKYKNKIYYVDTDNLTTNKKNIITEDKIYIRTPAILYKTIDSGEIASQANKGDELQVIDYDIVNDEGKVNVYKVSINNQEVYVYQKYTTLNQEEALKQYEPEKYYDIHNKRGNLFGGGHAGNLDYYPMDKPKFKDNVMPDEVYALYLNNGSNIIKIVDAYIEYAKTTKINAFVVDIKDDRASGYKSKVFEKYSPTNFSKAINSFDDYKTAIKKIKDAGFYVIGRITVFKDKYYIQDHPEDAIIDTRTNEPYLHSETYWPSPYRRSVWEFNVNLAKEAVKEMGFNEIQFDYVRFPDRVKKEIESFMDFKNEYNEEKAQTIQRFLMYATDELHKLNAYVSADVFGESAYTYVTAYGQYWAAISNVVDVISGMPYPDHFSKYEFDFKVPVWTVPYDLLYKWGSYVAKRQQETPSPAVVRTWVQVTDVPSYKHPGGYPYGFNEIDAQIRGIYDAGLKGGYMTWSSSSNLERYESQKEVYVKEYD